VLIIIIIIIIPPCTTQTLLQYTDFGANPIFGCIAEKPQSRGNADKVLPIADNVIYCKNHSTEWAENDADDIPNRVTLALNLLASYHNVMCPPFALVKICQTILQIYRQRDFNDLFRNTHDCDCKLVEA